MAVAYRTEAHSAVASSASIVVNKPSGVVSGDLLIAIIGFDDGGGARTINSVPSGWTLIDDSLGNAPNIYAYQKTAGGSEPSNYTWGLTGSCEGAGGILRIDGQAAVTFADGGEVSNDATPSFASTLTPVADSLLIMALMGRQTDGGVTFSSPAITTDDPSWSTAFNFKGGVSDDVVLAAFYANRTQATATGAWSTTLGAVATTDTISILIAVSPAVNVSLSPSVLSVATSVITPAVSAGANVTADSVSVATSIQAPTVSTAAPEWTNPDKPAATGWTNPDKP